MSLKSIIEKSDSKVRDFWLQVAGYPSFEELSKIIHTRDREILGAVREWAKSEMKSTLDHSELCGAVGDSADCICNWPSYDRAHNMALEKILTFITSAKEK